MDHFLLFMFRVFSYLSAHSSLVVTCWERDDLLALLYVVIYCAFVTFPCGVLGQVWCLIVSIPGLAFFLTSNMEVLVFFGLMLNVPQGPPRAIQSNLSV